MGVAAAVWRCACPQRSSSAWTSHKVARTTREDRGDTRLHVLIQRRQALYPLGSLESTGFCSRLRPGRRRRHGSLRPTGCLRECDRSHPGVGFKNVSSSKHFQNTSHVRHPLKQQERVLFVINFLFGTLFERLFHLPLVRKSTGLSRDDRLGFAILLPHAKRRESPCASVPRTQSCPSSLARLRPHPLYL